MVVFVELQPRKPATNVDGLGTFVDESRFVCVSASLKMTAKVELTLQSSLTLLIEE